MNQPSPIKRRKSRQIHVGNVPIGGDAPIAVQSMTNTETCDVEATVAQIQSIEAAGADLVRVSVPSMEAAEAFKAIRAQAALPLVADIHFDHKIALKVAESAWTACASILATSAEKKRSARSSPPARIEVFRSGLA